MVRFFYYSSGQIFFPNGLNIWWPCSYFLKHHFLIKLLWLLIVQLCKILGYFLFQHLVTLNSNWLHLVTLSLSWLHLVTLSLHCLHLITHNLHWLHLITLNLHRLHLVTLNLHWLHLVTLNTSGHAEFTLTTSGHAEFTLTTSGHTKFALPFDSRVFEEVEMKPYERKQFVETEIRLGWEARNRKEPSVESVEEVLVEEAQPDLPGGSAIKYPFHVHVTLTYFYEENNLQSYEHIKAFD